MKLTIDISMPDPFDTPWHAMTTAEKRHVYYVLREEFNQVANEVTLALNRMLRDHDCTLRAMTEVHISVSPKDDPRLP